MCAKISSFSLPSYSWRACSSKMGHWVLLLSVRVVIEHPVHEPNVRGLVYNNTHRFGLDSVCEICLYRSVVYAPMQLWASNLNYYPAGTVPTELGDLTKLTYLLSLRKLIGLDWISMTANNPVLIDKAIFLVRLMDSLARRDKKHSLQ